jgi:hypothetical protein
MTWEVQLIGLDSVLGELSETLCSGELVVARSECQYILQSSRFDNLPDVQSVRAEAERIVEALSGVSRLLLESAQSLKIGSVIEVLSNGRRNIFVQLEPAVLRISAGVASLQVTHADGTVEVRRRSDPIASWVRKALSNGEVARAVRLRDAGVLSWPDLYRLFEVLETGAGGEQQIIAEGWSTRSELRRFKHSANSVAAAGDEARHGVERTQPPMDPMKLADARGFLDRLLRLWLDSSKK